MAIKINNSMKKIKIIRHFFALILAISLSVGAMFVFFDNSFAWFSNNKTIEANGMGVSVEGIDAEAEYTVYLFDAKQNGVRYTNDGNDNDPKITDLKMQIHDIIFKSRNRYTPALFHIHLYNIKDKYKESDGNISIKLTRDNSPAYDIDANGTQQLPLKTTSVLRFTLVNNKGETWLSQDNDPDIAAKELYDNVDNDMYSKIVTNKNYTDTQDLDIDSKVFTTVNNNTITKETTVVLQVGYTETQVSSGELDLFLYLTYDEDLVSAFEHSVDIGQSGTSVGQVTTLTNDLSSLVVSFRND